MLHAEGANFYFSAFIDVGQTASSCVVFWHKPSKKITNKKCFATLASIERSTCIHFSQGHQNSLVFSNRREQGDECPSATVNTGCCFSFSATSTCVIFETVFLATHFCLVGGAGAPKA